jgi:hypothetical protein
MVDWGGERCELEPKKQSVEEMKNILLGIAKSQNKKVAVRNSPPTKKINKKQ